MGLNVLCIDGNIYHTKIIQIKNFLMKECKIETDI